MKYHGGKTRLGKRLATQILNFVDFYYSQRFYNQKIISGYWDPTVGGTIGVTKHLVTPLKERFSSDFSFFASDISIPLIHFWIAIQKGFDPPPKLSFKQYTYLKDTKEIQDPLHVFVQHASSFGGFPYNQGISFDLINRQLNSAHNTIERMRPILKSFRIFSQDIFDPKLKPKNLLIYIDPPYYSSRETKTLHKTLLSFDHKRFWEVVTEWSKDNLVFVSETSTLKPKEWMSIYSVEFKNRFGKNEYSRVEKLFVHRNNIPPRELNSFSSLK